MATRERGISLYILLRLSLPRTRIKALSSRCLQKVLVPHFRYRFAFCDDLIMVGNKFPVIHGIAKPLTLAIIVAVMEPIRPIQLDSAKASHLLSQEIAACVLELIGLEHKERDYLAILERKAELESRIAYLQQLEHSEMEGRL